MCTGSLTELHPGSHSLTHIHTDTHIRTKRHSHKLINSPTNKSLMCTRLLTELCPASHSLSHTDTNTTLTQSDTHTNSPTLPLTTTYTPLPTFCVHLVLQVLLICEERHAHNGDGLGGSGGLEVGVSADAGTVHGDDVHTGLRLVHAHNVVILRFLTQILKPERCC